MTAERPLDRRGSDNRDDRGMQTSPGAPQSNAEPEHQAVVAAGEHTHPPKPAETWAEESPAYQAPVELFSGPAEDDFWKANHQSQSFAGQTSYGYFAPAYRTGYEGYARHGMAGRTFEEAEPLLRQQYEKNGGKLEWAAARLGALAAWNRLSQRRIGTAQPTPDNQKLSS